MNAYGMADNSGGPATQLFWGTMRELYIICIKAE